MRARRDGSNSLYGKSKTKPWEHQEQGYELAMRLDGSGIWFDMGCGKTKVAVDVHHNISSWLTLVVCPKKAIDSVWPEEFETHCASTNTTVLALGGKEPTSKKAEMLERAIKQAVLDKRSLIVIINYDAVWRGELGKLISRIKWQLIIADEIHRIKSHSGKASKFMARLAWMPHRPKLIGLSGTPFPHSPLDAFGVCRFLDVSIFGKYWTPFRSRYAVCGGPHNNWVKGYKNIDELTKKVAEISISVRSEDVQDLPEFQDIPLTYEMNPKQKKIYEEFEAEMIAETDNDVMTASNALVKMLRLQQIASGFAVDDQKVITNLSHGKSELLAELLEDLPREPLVVFCQFREDLRRIAETAVDAKRGYFEISGRRDDLTEWKEAVREARESVDDLEPKPFPVLGVQIQSGGEAIDLTLARYCVYWTTGVSLGKYAQSRKRVHRPGQEFTVFYYTLAAKGTVEESIARSMKRRKKMIDGILDKMGPKYAELFNKGQEDWEYGS